MLFAFSIGLGIAVLAAFAIDPRRGAFAYLAATLLAPTVTLDGFSFRIEHVLAPGMLFVSMLLNPVGASKWWRGSLAKSYAAWWGWVMIISLASYLDGADTTASWTDAYSLFRPMIVMAVFYMSFAASKGDDASGSRAMPRLLMLFVLASVPLGLLAVAQVLDYGPARVATGELYSSFSRTAITTQTARAAGGYVWRAVSVFENVSYAATYFVIAVGTGVMLVMFGRKHSSLSSRLFTLCATITAFVGGVFTMSATFWAGLVLVAVTIGLHFRRGNGFRSALWAGVFLVLGVSVGYAFLAQSGDLGATTQYMIMTKLLGGHGFAVRYGGLDTSESIFSAIESALQRPLVGWGVVRPAGVVVNDSLYVYLLHSGGIIGILLFGAFVCQYVALSQRCGPEMKAISRLWLGVALVCGLGCITLFIPRLCDFWWGVTGVIAGIASRRKTQAGVGFTSWCVVLEPLKVRSPAESATLCLHPGAARPHSIS